MKGEMHLLCIELNYLQYMSHPWSWHPKSSWEHLLPQQLLPYCPSPASLCSSPADHLLFFKQARHVPISGLLPLLVSPSVTLFFLSSLLKCHPIRELHTGPPFSLIALALFFFMTLITTWHYTHVFAYYLSPLLERQLHEAGNLFCSLLCP